MSEPTLSVVVPVRDEEDSVRPLTVEVHAALDGLEGGYELVFVDDGSTDRSVGVIQDLVAEDERVRLVRLARPAGKSAALEAGFRSASGRLVAMLDADLQYDPGEILRLLGALDDADAAVGVRVQREDSWVRRTSSRIANGIRRRLTGDSTRDSASGLQVFRRDVLALLPVFEGMHRFLPTLVRVVGGRVIEMSVSHRQRSFGRSKYGVRNRAFRGLVDLLAVRWLMKRWIDRTAAHEVAPGGQAEVADRDSP